MAGKVSNRGPSFRVSYFLRAVKATKAALMRSEPAQYAAGVAYFGTLSFFPLVAALVAIASLTLSSSQVTAAVNDLASYMPKDIASLLATQLQYASMHQQANVIVVVLALLLSVIGVSGAIDSLMRSITAMHQVKDTRSFFRQKLVSLIVTVGFIGGMALLLPLIAISTHTLVAWGADSQLIQILSIVRWIALIVIATLGLGVINHYALPKRRSWRWFSWGSLVATAMWLIITAVFFIYLQYFSNFSNSYSFFAGIIALMIWLNFSAYSVLIGASVDHDIDDAH